MTGFDIFWVTLVTGPIIVAVLTFPLDKGALIVRWWKNFGSTGRSKEPARLPDPVTNWELEYNTQKVYYERLQLNYVDLKERYDVLLNTTYTPVATRTVTLPSGESVTYGVVSPSQILRGSGNHGRSYSEWSKDADKVEEPEEYAGERVIEI